MNFTMVYGPSGIGKESIGRELAIRNKWKLFPQHLAFDIASAVVGFGNNGFEKYQRDICLNAFRTFIENKVSGVVFTFCYVSPASDYFIEGLFSLLDEFKIDANFIKLSCDIDEHIQRVTSSGRKNTNKIQTQEYLEDYLSRFDFSQKIVDKETYELDTTGLSIHDSVDKVQSYIAYRSS